MTKLYRPFLLFSFSLFVIVTNIFVWIILSNNAITKGNGNAVVEEIPIDTIASEEEEPVPVFISQDLKTFFLKNHVKEVAILYQKYDPDTNMPLDEYEPSEWYKFDVDGRLTSYSTKYNENYTIKRNTKGQITSIEEIASEEQDITSGMSYKYGTDGYPTSYSVWSSDTYEEIYTVYDDNHWPIKGKAGECMPPAEFSYNDIDNKGNWRFKNTTIRFSKVFKNEEDKEHEERRSITYYDN